MQLLTGTDHAFPRPEGGDAGISAREYFACHIAAGILAGWVGSAGMPSPQARDEVANVAVCMADALIARLNKQ